MPVDIRHMLKVYNYVNDEKRPKVNLKFLAIVGILIGACLGVGAAAWSQQLFGSPSPPGMAATEKTDQIRLTPAELAGDPTASLDARIDAWYDEHPSAHVDSITPVYDQGVLVGYDVAYHE